MSPSTLFFLLFMTVALGVFALMHYYFWRRMVKDPGFNRRDKRIGTTVLICLFSFSRPPFSWQNSSPFSGYFLWYGSPISGLAS